ncbi:MAG: pyridoxamine 5'-phosphate oxidase family protein [Neisseriaceae bacterium]|nr:pyridoxamine 5'-phosphate oxidase family protein [Neisseriaceae bacterium]
MSTQKTARQLSDSLIDLHGRSKTLMMATQTEDATPHISYSPYALLNGKYYVFLSALAEHTRHLTERPQASIMLIEDEQDTRNLYARARLSWVAQARVIAREATLFNQAIEQLKARTGATIDLLVSLNDFDLFELTPQHGRLVLGFGQAYQIKPEDLIAIMAHEKAINLTHITTQ